MMSSALYDTLILSDLHLGSPISRAQEALRMLRDSSFRRLVLLGDIFADLNFARLTKDHWKFLGYIRKLSNPKRKVEVVWVEGNHDAGLANMMAHLVGVKVYHEYAWEFQGRRHIAVHGHQFDRFAVNNVVLSNLGSFLHLQLQKLDFKDRRFSRYMDLMNTRWLRLSSKVAAGALAHARFHNAWRIFCGHTHEALRREQDGIEYYNSGSWTDSQATYITVEEEGVQIRTYEGPVRADEPQKEEDLLDTSTELAPEDHELEEVGV